MLQITEATLYQRRKVKNIIPFKNQLFYGNFYSQKQIDILKTMQKDSKSKVEIIYVYTTFHIYESRLNFIDNI
jgi:hypothetical protein